jgi:hypothetical protein
MLDAVAGHRRAVRVVESAAAGLCETGAGVRDDDSTAHGVPPRMDAQTKRGGARAKARTAASAQ